MLWVFVLPLMATAQEPWEETGWLPEKGNHLVYDYCNILTSNQNNELESRLTAFNDSTSNQIAIIIVPAFGGNDIQAFAFEVGDEWGIGQKELANGVLIVVKPKDDTKGEVEIATGVGLEGALPDIFCKRIIENEMIPHFRDGEYYEGIVAALDIIEPVCAGEYSYEQYKEKNDSGVWPLIFIVAIIVVVIVLCFAFDDGTFGDNGSYGGGSFYGGSTRINNWGSGSSGGSFSSGGFGGFGGGSFGGGGAHGSW